MPLNTHTYIVQICLSCIYIYIYLFWMAVCDCHTYMTVDIGVLQERLDEVLLASKYIHLVQCSKIQLTGIEDIMAHYMYVCTRMYSTCIYINLLLYYTRLHTGEPSSRASSRSAASRAASYRTGTSRASTSVSMHSNITATSSRGPTPWK